MRDHPIEAMRDHVTSPSVSRPDAAVRAFGDGTAQHAATVALEPPKSGVFDYVPFARLAKSCAIDFERCRLRW